MGFEILISYALFWMAFVVLFYTYVLFPLWVGVRGMLGVWMPRLGDYNPSVSIVIAAYNEEAVALQKLDNTFDLDYPKNLLEVIFASDGSNDGTNDLVRNYQGGPVKFLALPRQGKNLTLNSAVAESMGEILVFTDADTMFESDALKHLVAPLNDPEVGGVAGDYIMKGNRNKGGGEKDFWNFERKIKALQSRAGSVTSAWGPIYAIRKTLFKEIPPGVTDDYFISVQPLLNGKRLIFEPKAVALGPVADSYHVEFRRKVRIITAGLRSVWHTRQLLNPFRYGLLAVQIFSHKVLRRLMGLPILLLFITSLILWQHGPFYSLAAGAQLAFHGLAFMGFLFHETKVGRLRLLRLPFFFDMVYTASALAIINVIFGSRHDIWVPQHAQKN